jgi:hypothetical protein
MTVWMTLNRIRWAEKSCPQMTPIDADEKHDGDSILTGSRAFAQAASGVHSD